MTPFVKENLPVMDEIRLEPQVSRMMRDNPRDTHKFLAVLFTELNDSFKIDASKKLTKNEIIDFVGDLAKEFYHFRLPDFVLFVRNAKKGMYGKAFNRLDVPTIWEWIREYDRDRDVVIEKGHMRMKLTDEHERGSPAHKLNVEKMKLSLKDYSLTPPKEKEQE